MEFVYQYNFNILTDTAFKLAIWIAIITAVSKVVLRIIDTLFKVWSQKMQQGHEEGMNRRGIALRTEEIRAGLFDTSKKTENSMPKPKNVLSKTL